MTLRTSSFNHKVRRIDERELEILRQSADDEEEWAKQHPRYGPPTRRREQCSLKACREKAIFWASYEYVTGRKGRVSRNDKQLCHAHAMAFAKKNLIDTEVPL